jgi:hypothetical protein
MEVNYICRNTIKPIDKAFYLTPSIGIYTYNGVSIKSCTIGFAWLVFSFCIDIIIKR